MGERVFLVHGWSVRSTATYQALHLQLARHGYRLEDVHLGRYVSLDDRIEIAEIAQAMHEELQRHMGAPPWPGPFHILTHSTGALVAKHWIVHHYAGRFLQGRPLGNVVFLAGPHFGSRLAHHGRSMLAHAAYFGPTGRRVLTALELGSTFSWESNEEWLDPDHWRRKGIRPFCLAGDRVKRHPFRARILPAGYEPGSDMVVRVPSANLNFRRFTLDGVRGAIRPAGAIEDVPFAALAEFVHSGKRHGLMNSITRSADPARHESLRLILRCLAVGSETAYRLARRELAAAHEATRARRPAFAQLDLRFRSPDGKPITDYSFALGELVKGRERASPAIAHTHKNEDEPGHFTVYLDMRRFHPDRTYTMAISADSGTDLYRYLPAPYRVEVQGSQLDDLVAADRTTQLDVVLGKDLARSLFVFHRGDDPRLHVSWDRSGELTDEGDEPR